MARNTNTPRTRASLWVGGSAVLIGLLLLVGMLLPASAGAVVSSIDLHNSTAEAGEDCPAGGAAYWHFVFAPNNGSASFVTITLNLTSETVSFTGDEIVPNGSQTDNVFVAVPAGHELTDLTTNGSSATYSGMTPSRFNLSHVCEGTVPPSTTTTTAPSTTTTTAPSTTTTTAPSTTTTAAAAVAPTSTAPLVDPGVAPTSAPTDPAALARSVTATSGVLPVTGGARVPLVALGALLVAAGFALLLVRRQMMQAAANATR